MVTRSKHKSIKSWILKFIFSISVSLPNLVTKMDPPFHSTLGKLAADAPSMLLQMNTSHSQMDAVSINRLDHANRPRDSAHSEANRLSENRSIGVNDSNADCCPPRCDRYVTYFWRRHLLIDDIRLAHVTRLPLW